MPEKKTSFLSRKFAAGLPEKRQLENPTHLCEERLRLAYALNTKKIRKKWKKLKKHQTWPATWPSTLAMFGSGSSSNGPRSLTARGHVAGHVTGHVRRSAVTFWPRFGHVQRGQNMAHNMAEHSGHITTWPGSSLSRSCSGHVRGHPRPRSWPRSNLIFEVFFTCFLRGF